MAEVQFSPSNHCPQQGFPQASRACVCIYLTSFCLHTFEVVGVSGCEAQWATSGKFGATTWTQSVAIRIATCPDSTMLMTSSWV